MKSKERKLIDAFWYAEEHPEKSLTEIGSLFGVDRHTLSGVTKQTFKNYVYESKIEPDRLYWFTQEELEIIQYYNDHETVTYADIFKKFRKPNKPDTLNRWLEVLGIEKHNRQYKYHYNRNKFNQILTEEDAYWLGFILADGYLNEDRGFLQIKLGHKDKAHLIKFAKYMGFTSEEEITNAIQQCVGGAYTRDNLCWVLKINCRQISDNLKQYGIFQGKSGHEQPYSCQTQELEKAYIRGLIDGDGFISQDLKRCGIVGSQEVLTYIKNYLQRYVTDVTTNSINSHGSIFKLEFNGAIKTKNIITHFYKDATIYLDRKFDLFQKM